MKRITIVVTLVLLAAASAVAFPKTPPVLTQAPSRDATRERLRTLLNTMGSKVNKARNSSALMRQLLRFSDSNFLYWGADETGDIFAGYTFTLESGFPDEAIKVVLYSIKPLDQFVGQMRPMIDGTAAR